MYHKNPLSTNFGVEPVIIIGGGTAGMAAAQYAARSALSSLVLEEKAEGGQAVFIDRLENYPGILEPVNGFDFALAMKSQAEAFGAKFSRGKVKSIEKTESGFSLFLEGGAQGARLWGKRNRHKRL